MDYTSFYTSLPIDPVVIVLVLLAGQFQKHYLEDFLPNKKAALKTLITSFFFVMIYGLLFWVSGAFTKELPVKWFLSYAVATSLYELLLKKFLDKYFPEEIKSADVAKILVLVFLSASLTGCAATKKKIRTTEDLTVHSSQAERDSAHITVITTSDKQTSDTAAFKQYLQTLHNSLEIVFDTADHTVYTEPIVLEKKDGKTVLNTGGRKLVAAKFNDLQQTETIDSSHASASRELTQGWKDSFAASVDSILTDIRNKNTEQVTTSNNKWVIIGGVILIIIGGVLYWLFKPLPQA